MRSADGQKRSGPRLHQLRADAPCTWPAGAGQFPRYAFAKGIPVPFAFSCPSCQKRLRVPDTAAGKPLSCPACNATVSVPTPLAPGEEEAPEVYPETDDEIPAVGPAIATRSAELEVKVWASRLAVFFRVCTPVIEINGKPHRRAWGTHYFDLAPGRHKVRIYFAYLAMPECGANEIEVNLRANRTTRIQFLMPPWMLAKGDIREIRC